MQSPFSRKQQGKWYLVPTALHTGPSLYLNWANFLPKDGGTKHQRAYLIESAQGLMEAMCNAPREQNSALVAQGTLSHGTVYNWFYKIRSFARWMIDRGVWRFSALTPEDVSDYLETCSLRLDGEGAVTLFTWRARISLLREMWSLRTEYVGPLRVDPDKMDITKPMRLVRRSNWKALDESAAMPLIRDAVIWLDENGNCLEETLASYWQHKSRNVGKTLAQRATRLAQWYRELDEDPRFLEIRKHLCMPTENTFLVLRKYSAMCRGACAIVLLFTIGLRVGELCRLDADGLRMETDSLGNSVARLYGVAAKQGGKRRYWIICEYAVRAVEHLLHVASFARAATGQTGLWLEAGAGAFFAPGRKVARVTAECINLAMKVFANSPMRANAPKIARLHPHVARKTFARFVVIRDKRALGPLAHHYGHIHRAVTDGYYVGSDMQLAELLEEEGRQDLAQGLMDLLLAKTVGGKASVNLQNIRASASKFKGKKGLQRLVDKLIDDGVQIAPCDWGYCVYSKFFSSCSGDDKGPNESRRSPDVCSGCANFCVTRKHQPFWEARLQRDDNFLAQNGLSAQTVAVVEERRENTAKILLKLVVERDLQDHHN